MTDETAKNQIKNMQGNYALFSKTQYIFPAKMSVAAAKATAVLAGARRQSTSRNLLPASFANAKGCDSMRASLKND